MKLNKIAAIAMISGLCVGLSAEANASSLSGLFATANEGTIVAINGVTNGNGALWNPPVNIQYFGADGTQCELDKNVAASGTGNNYVVTNFGGGSNSNDNCQNSITKITVTPQPVNGLSNVWGNAVSQTLSFTVTPTSHNFSIDIKAGKKPVFDGNGNLQTPGSIVITPTTVSR